MITPDWVAPFIDRQTEFLRHAGVDVNVFHINGSKNPLNYLRAWRQVNKLLGDEHYDLIHAQWGQSAFPALPKRVPLVVTFRGSDVVGIVGDNGHYLWLGYFLNAFSRSVALLADQAVVVSESLISKLPKREYHIIPSGLDLDLFRPMEYSNARRLLGWSLERKVVFFGGNPLVPEKRYALACAAVRLLEKSFPAIEIIAAQGIKHTQMPHYINASDVLLLTSMHEGSPNVIKEALACNVPVVSTDVGDVRQRIGNIEGCVVCADDRPETISNALTSVLMRNARVAGRETVLELDESLLVQKMLAVYEQAVNRK